MGYLSQVNISVIPLMNHKSTSREKALRALLSLANDRYLVHIHTIDIKRELSPSSNHARNLPRDSQKRLVWKSPNDPWFATDILSIFTHFPSPSVVAKRELSPSSNRIQNSTHEPHKCFVWKVPTALRKNFFLPRLNTHIQNPSPVPAKRPVRIAHRIRLHPA